MARVPPDANDVIVIRLNESSGGTRPNEGTAGGVWTDYGNPISGATGILGNALYVPGTFLVNARSGSGGNNDTIVSPNISLSGWVFMRRPPNYAAELFNKQYFLNGWSSPFLTFGFQMHSASNNQCDLYITLNGTLQSIRTPTSFTIPHAQWAHIGGTWDGSTLRFYINGSLAVSGNFSGTIDFNNSSLRGQWYVGGIPGVGTNQDPGAIFQDIRVANVTRPQSYFANIYHQGVFVNG